MASAIVLALIAFHLVVHQDEGGWVGKANWPGTTTLDGHLVQWAWGHVADAAALVDAEGVPLRAIPSQNLYRFVGAYVLALLREPLGGFYAAAVGAHVLAWLTACGALYALARRAGASARAGVLAATFTATGPGFIGYLGQVDAHPFGYAAVALWLALVECSSVLAPPAGASAGWLRPVVAGLALCVAAYTMEIGYLLLLFAWIYYGAPALLSQLRPRSVDVDVRFVRSAAPKKVFLEWAEHPPGRRARITQLTLLTVAFLVPYLGFRVLAEQVLFERVVPFDEPTIYLRIAWQSLAEDGPATWLSDKTASIAVRWMGAFPPPVTALALLGTFVVPRRWLLWAAGCALIFCTAVALTKPATRDLYLAFP
ncbi:MAG: hypothetical protein M3442_08620, partial [Chloroflexota bacterium]|nr:hypothetical protein [Chloroflexota bacterium]